LQQRVSGTIETTVDSTLMEELNTRRLKLTVTPTPLERLENLSNQLGTEVWIKRDDLTGFVMGGNKTRKAEFLLADALHEGADAILTVGAMQSNHAVAIAAASKRLGKECHLFLSGDVPDLPTANVLLDRLSGANLHFVASSSDRQRAMEEFAAKLRSEGRRTYAIPLGGSNEVGSQGYVCAFLELLDQLRSLPPKPTKVLFASSSGGTYAGLLVGKVLAENANVDLLGIRVDRDPEPEKVICVVASSLASKVGLRHEFHPREVVLNPDYAGAGYGVPTEQGMDALRRVWQTESILLDPVYTAKAMAGLIDLASRKALGDTRLVFLHTGGNIAVFGCDPRLLA
jgi:L-cysteate sulfo-lyase